MLRAVSDKFEDTWDEALPWVLFSYRECPVDSLGFSPFELIYSYPVQGPLAIIKKAWLGEDNSVNSTKQSVVSFMLETREGLRVTREIDVFEPGQLVLALLPRPGQPLEAKWKGPYKVLSRIGKVDYVISTPNKRKPTRLCHINMLKPYIERQWNHDVVKNCLVFDPIPFSDVEHPEFCSLNDEDQDRFCLNHLIDEKKQKELGTLLNTFSILF